MLLRTIDAILDCAVIEKAIVFINPIIWVPGAPWPPFFNLIVIEQILSYRNLKYVLIIFIIGRTLLSDYLPGNWKLERTTGN